MKMNISLAFWLEKFCLILSNVLITEKKCIYPFWIPSLGTKTNKVFTEQTFLPYSVSWWGGLSIQSFRWDENPDPDLDLDVHYKHNMPTGPNLGYSVSRHGGST